MFKSKNLIVFSVNDFIPLMTFTFLKPEKVSKPSQRYTSLSSFNAIPSASIENVNWKNRRLILRLK